MTSDLASPIQNQSRLRPVSWQNLRNSFEKVRSSPVPSITFSGGVVSVHLANRESRSIAPSGRQVSSLGIVSVLHCGNVPKSNNTECSKLEQVKISEGQIRAARGLLGLSQTALAERAGVSSMTVKRAEGSGSPYPAQGALRAIRDALKAAGVEFIAENGGGPGVRLRK
ncbi:helix-turn-helix domain-containing protein [Roseovarius sp. PS-C2]|nr:helix-turn-helix domain-containing protein [Roseovarius sp. PS-C2]